MTSKKPSSEQRILLLESITASGLPRSACSPSLWREAVAMREALARDLRALIGDDLIEALTPQCCLTEAVAHPVDGHPPWRIWRNLLAGCEAVLPVAPETGGELLALTVLARVTGTRCLGSHALAVQRAGSKRATAGWLARAGLPVVPIWPARRRDWPWSPAGWVVKPDDGVGAEATRRVCFQDSPDRAGEDPQSDRCALGWGGGSDARLMVQPFVDGPSGSLFVFGGAGELRLLASSTQYIEWDARGARLVALGVNETLLPWAQATALAKRIADALPGLRGFWGADFILGRDGVQVLEVNPRPTSTYPALAESLGWNPATLLLGLPAPQPAGCPGRSIRLTFE